MENDLICGNGDIFLISSLNGDVGKIPHQGLFCADVRHLSKLELTINNNPLEVLTSREIDFHTVFLVLGNSSSKTLSRFDLTIIRKRTITKVLSENIEIKNNTEKKTGFVMDLNFDSDFSDIFEIRTLIPKQDQKHQKSRLIKRGFSKKNNQLSFSYTRDTYRRTTVIHFDNHVQMKGPNASLHISLKPREQYNFSFSIASLVGRKTITTRKLEKIKEESKILKEWNWVKIKLETDWENLKRAFYQSISDLAALHIYQEEIPGKTTLLSAAGIPWYVAIFGRDSLITAYQTIILGPELAMSTLKFLAKYQGKEVNLQKEEQPGKILHEIRFGEAAYFRDWVSFPYFGSIDATPLFLILLSETYRFGATKKFIMTMKEPALLALNWIDKYADLDQDGFVEYQKTSEKGLENQNWRDSWNSMAFENGELAKPPIASSDVQGYVYDAKLRISEIARDVWKDTNLSERLKQEAKILKERFNKVFWIEDKGYFALGLDNNKRQIDSLSSSIGQLLWSGIIAEEKIAKTAKLLFSKNLYGGWGVRTISKNNKGFSPVTYHKGTVWPHDNSLIAAGLIKAGRPELALRIISDLVTASSYFNYRLPEVFAGFDRSEIQFPVKYPTSASPQAWSAAATILFLRLILGIEPDVRHKKININPLLPKNINFVKLDGIAAFKKQFYVAASKKGSKIIQRG